MTFDEWWAVYPRKVDKADALKAFFRVPPGERHWLVESTPLWVGWWQAEGRELRFVPYPATFVNKGTWREPPPVPTPAEPRGFAGIRSMLGGAG